MKPAAGAIVQRMGRGRAVYDPARSSAARVAELVDARDLKSLGGNPMPVRSRPRAPAQITRETAELPGIRLFRGRPGASRIVH